LKSVGLLSEVQGNGDALPAVLPCEIKFSGWALIYVFAVTSFLTCDSYQYIGIALSV